MQPSIFVILPGHLGKLCNFYIYVINQQDAKVKEIYKYKTTKTKLHRTNAAIWFNKTCRHKQLTPTYINISINEKNQQCQRTLKIAKQYRISQETTLPLV